ncbi:MULTISPECIES: hypothetical protein [unclassified Streptomyces]|uniref:hypothetical protein n=1 Tax=unclassified Streptomyces TaxID=2593676 RepID=UPI001F46DA99|nr:hypothetical protein [Streptomyces sp. HmicA12]
MKSGLGRVLAGALAVAALATTAACGAGGDDAKGDAAKDAGAKPAAKASASAKPELKPLSEAELTKVVITKDDAKGWRVGKTPDADIPDVSVPAKPASCQAIADLFLLGTEPDAAARVSRSLTSQKQTDATVIRMALLAHKEGDAKKVVADLRTQSEKCDSYEHTDYQYTGIKPLKAPALGDEAVAYSLTGKIDGETIPMAYTIVRSGSTLTVFYGMNVLDSKKAEVPAELIEAQVTKLEKAAK